MNISDDELKKVFSELRSEDMERLEIPSFEQVVDRKKSARTRYLIPIGVAASLILGVLIFLQPDYSNTSEQSGSEEIILLGKEQTESTDELLDGEEAFVADSWESPTSSLIADF